MATSVGAGLQKERTHIRAVLAPLVSSMRGQIFMSNLEAALVLFPAKNVRQALMSVKTSDARRMHEEDYLPHLKFKLQDKAHDLILSCKSNAFLHFAPNGWVVNVLPFASFQAFYEDPLASLSGHSSLTKAPGTSISSFRTTAATAPVFWLAARDSISPSQFARSDAQGARDLLGLVHYGMNIDLVAMHLKLVAPEVYRPTVIEANPNARFRHTNPKSPGENRWGTTVNLNRLESALSADEIDGIAELVATQTKLCNCDEVEFYYLGTTKTDRSTTGADKRFLDRLLNGRDGSALLKTILDQLMK